MLLLQFITLNLYIIPLLISHIKILIWCFRVTSWTNLQFPKIWTHVKLWRGTVAPSSASASRLIGRSLPFQLRLRVGSFVVHLWSEFRWAHGAMSCSKSVDYRSKPCPIYDFTDCVDSEIVTTCRVISNKVRIPCLRYVCEVKWLRQCRPLGFCGPSSTPVDASINFKIASLF